MLINENFAWTNEEYGLTMLNLVNQQHSKMVLASIQ